MSKLIRFVSILENFTNLQELFSHFQTSELAQLQAGEMGPVRLIVSTIPELEHMIPWLLEAVKQGRVVDVCSLPFF